MRLSNLSKEKTKTFLIEYLTALNKSLKGKVKIEDEALQIIYNSTNGSPRLLSAMCHYLCSSSEFTGHLDKKIISKIMGDLEFKMELKRVTEKKKVIPKI